MHVGPYLFFDGRCAEALEFYQKILGAKVEMLMRYKESPAPPHKGMPPGSENKIMHASFRVGATLIMASDGLNGGTPEFKGFRLAITASSDEEARRIFDGLKDGGKVQQPLGKSFFSSSFGMVTDRFGVMWMVMVGQ